MVLAFDQREIVLRADFDQIDERGILSVPVRFDDGPRPPQRGEFVYLLDGTGNGCVGYVAKLRDGVARVMPVDETWMGDPPPSRVPRRNEGAVHQALDAAAIEGARRDQGGVHRAPRLH